MLQAVYLYAEPPLSDFVLNILLVSSNRSIVSLTRAYGCPVRPNKSLVARRSHGLDLSILEHIRVLRIVLSLGGIAKVSRSGGAGVTAYVAVFGFIRVIIGWRRVVGPVRAVASVIEGPLLRGRTSPGPAAPATISLTSLVGYQGGHEDERVRDHVYVLGRPANVDDEVIERISTQLRARRWPGLR